MSSVSEATVETFEAARSVVLRSRAEMIPIADGLWLCCQTFGPEIDGKTHEAAPKWVGRWVPSGQEYAVVNAGGRLKVRRGERLTLTPFNQAQWMVAESGWASRLLQDGYDAFAKTLRPLDQVFAALKAGETITQDRWVKVNLASQMVFNASDEAMPQQISFNYLNGSMHEERYPLPEALAILDRRPDIQLETERSVGQPGRVRLPRYSCEEGREYGLEFVWRPTADLFRQVYAHAQKKDPYPSLYGLYQAVTDLDVFGLKALDRYQVEIEPAPPAVPRRSPRRSAP